MKRILISISLILTICLIVTFSFSTADSATEFKVKKLNVVSGVEYAKDEVLVKFKNSSRVILRSGTTIMSTGRYTGVNRLRVPSGKTVEDIINEYKSDPNVEYAEPNYIYHAHMTPNDTYYNPYQWHMPAINVELAWDITSGSGVIIGIIDTGIAYENYGSFLQAPDLAGTNFVAGYDFVNNDSHANDDGAHGTHVCGTIAQTTNNNLGCAGVAFNATIMPIKVLDSSGSGYVTDISEGIIYAADNGCNVINMSLGGSIGSSTLQNAVEYAYNNGVTIICSAGNAGTPLAQYPAAYSQCISVSATRYDDEIAGYSSYGSTIDICAPGGDIDVDQNGDGYGDGVLQQTFAQNDPTDFGYYFYEGTSMSAPHVTGSAAMVIAAGGGSMSPSEVRNILEGTATDLGASGWDQYYGHGKVNVYAAVLEAQGGGTAPVAAFSGAPVSGDVPLTVTFTDASANSPTSWSWTFGDGGTSTAQNPVYEYTSAGTYTVVLAVSNSYGSDTETKTDYISVTEPSNPPVAAFTGSPTSGEVPLTVTFADASTNNPTSWSWDFGDGGTSTAQNPSYEYVTMGTYTVELTVTNAYGSDTETKLDYITVTEQGQTEKAYALSDIPVTGNVSGSYANTLTSDNTYETITEVAYTGHPRKTYSYLEHKWDFNIPSGTEVTFYLEAYRPNSSDGDNFLFEYSTDGVNYNSLVTVASATEQVYSVAMPASTNGVLTVRVTDTRRVWGGTSNDDIVIDEMYIAVVAGASSPIANFSGSPTSGAAPLVVSFADISTGSPTSWSWTFGDGGTSTAQNPSHEYTSVGTYTVSLTATNAYGNDTETKTGYITVTDGSTSSVHISAIAVGRSANGRNLYGNASVTVVDQNGSPVANAAVYGFFNEPNTNIKNALTGSDGVASLISDRTKDAVSDFCFEVTNVILSGYTYDSTANAVTKSCESGGVFSSESRILSGRGETPKSYTLAQNYPNPFNPVTTIKFNLPEKTHVRLEIFDVQGKLVETLVNKTLGAGFQSSEWTATNVASGVYFYRLSTPSFTEMKKMILLR